VRNLDSTGLKRLHRQWRRRTGGRVAVVCEDVATPYNVGSIVRTAAAYRVERLVLVGSTAPIDHPKTAKTALGCERFVTVETADDITSALDRLREDGYRCVGVELADEALPLHEATLGDAVALVVGHEDRGLSRACLDGCDEVAFIPLLGRVGSLNVATATAVALYEVRRRDWLG
jgi:tRNA (guanosine-2'-O-)-methyltransferase